MPVFVDPLPADRPDPELLALRQLQVRVQRLLEEPGHITRAEVQAALDDTQGAASGT